MIDINHYFSSDKDDFTVYVVTKQFSLQKGKDFFASYINTEHYISTEAQMEKMIKKSKDMIRANVAPTSDLTSIFSKDVNVNSMEELIGSLCKLSTVYEHKAIKATIHNPVIILEDKISKRAITKFINLHSDCDKGLKIIIILKDDSFDNAKKLLSECPNNIIIKLINNAGEYIFQRVENAGADNIDIFINSFAEQCYYTCAETSNHLLLNSEWSQNIIYKEYGPSLMRFRTNLLFEQKDEIKKDLSTFTDRLTLLHGKSENEEKLIRTFECMSKLFRVFCNDIGGKDIQDAFELAQFVDNEILKAHVYRYADFLPNCTKEFKEDLYQAGYDIFKQNSMDDCAIYCKNNQLVEQFYTDRVYPSMFKDLMNEAKTTVPGLVGLSHIYNNAGVACLYGGAPDEAIDYFNDGITYAANQHRIVQKLGLKSNKMIALSYSCVTIDENEIEALLRQIVDGMGINKLPFLSADYALNVIAIAFRQKPVFAKKLINIYKIEDLINVAFATNPMGANHRLLQMQYLSKHYGEYFNLLEKCEIPRIKPQALGKRDKFIEKYGYNPFDFETWL